MARLWQQQRDIRMTRLQTRAVVLPACRVGVLVCTWSADGSSNRVSQRPTGMACLCGFGTVGTDPSALQGLTIG